MSLALPAPDDSLTFRADVTSVDELWLSAQLGLSVICCCLPTYGLLSPKESILKPAGILFSKMTSKIVTSVTGRAKSKQNPEPRKPSGFSSKFRQPGNAEADGVGLIHAGGDFELAEQHVAGRDSSSNVKNAVEIV